MGLQRYRTLLETSHGLGMFGNLQDPLLKGSGWSDGGI